MHVYTNKKYFNKYFQFDLKTATDLLMWPFQITFYKSYPPCS